MPCPLTKATLVCAAAGLMGFTGVTPALAQVRWLEADLQATSTAPALTSPAVIPSSPVGTLTLTGSGAGFTAAADDLHFTFAAVSGDFDLRARVSLFTGDDADRSLSLMVRDSLSPDAASTAVIVSPATGLAVRTREIAGDVAFDRAALPGVVPVWLRLARTGDVVTAYSSADGARWATLGTAAAGETDSYVGLAVAGDPMNAKPVATISNMTIVAVPPAPPSDAQTPASTGSAAGLSTTGLVPLAVNDKPPKPPKGDTPPTVTLSVPATANVGDVITLTASAADVDGSVARVDFYDASALVGSVTAAPYTLRWTATPLGVHTFVAKATDDAGGVTTSLPAAVVAYGALPAPTVMKLVTFTPPSNYASSVGFYRIEFRRYGSTAKSAPLATQDIGLPAVIGGLVQADVAATIATLPKGSNYYAIVVAIGPKGSAASIGSGAFAK